MCRKLFEKLVNTVQGEAIHNYAEGEDTRYIFTLEGMTEAEVLEMNPDATWPGIEMYYDQLEKANRPLTAIKPKAVSLYMSIIVLYLYPWIFPVAQSPTVQTTLATVVAQMVSSFSMKSIYH